MLKKTPLNEVHKELKARMIDFGGWEMPVQYSNVIEEHQAVRNAAGLFDVSHILFFCFWLFMFNFIPLALADSQPLAVTTNTLVTEEGKVRIYLTLKN